MNLEFLVFANLVLICRLGLLLGGPASSSMKWWKAGAIQLAALGLFALSPTLVEVALTVAAFNVLAALLERQHYDQNGTRFLVGSSFLVVLSFWFSPSGGVHFRPELASVWEQICSHTSFGIYLRLVTQRKTMAILLGFLLSANETNLLIRWILEYLKIGLQAGEIDTAEYNRGRIIGVLERALIFFFVLTGQFGAVGFVLAAKGFTRFKDLEVRGIAEYVLVGTLLSSTIAMALGSLIRLSL
jgi:hypothetical protein